MSASNEPKDVVPRGSQAPAVARPRDRRRGDGRAARGKPRCSRRRASSRGTLLTMLPFAAALAIASLGQTLVVMQGGIDLSVAGGLSLYVVIVTQVPGRRQRPALAGDRHRARSRPSPPARCNGFLIGRMRLNPIVATLGTNALLYGAVLWYSAGIPTHDHRPPARASAAGPGSAFPAPVYFAVAATAVVTAVVEADAGGPSLRGRRRERDGRPHRRAAGETPPGRRLRLGAAPLLPRRASCTPASSTSRRPTRATTTSCRPSRPSCSAAPRCSAVAATSSRPRSPRCSCRSSTSSCSRSASRTRPHARPGGGARRRRRALHRRLGAARRDALSARRAAERRATPEPAAHRSSITHGRGTFTDRKGARAR